MPFSFWIALIFLLIAGVVLVGAVLAKNEEKKGVFGLAVALGLLSGLFMLIASANIVPVRNVGIVSSFSRPTGEITGSGLKFVAPWKKINDWDASVQTADHTGDKCVTVRIGSLAPACVENKVRYQVKPDAAPEQYMAYKGDFKNMQQNFFETELQNALNEAFSDYNPLSTVNLQTGQTSFDGSGLAKELQGLLQARVGGQIIVESVVVPFVRHDAQTEANIKQFQDVIVQNRILEQKKKNAETEKQTAELLQSLPLQYTVNKCLDLAKDLGKEPGLCLGGAAPIWQVAH